MRTSLKHLIVVFTVLAAGGLTLSAQSRGGDRLPRILDPLGILPTPRQVLRTLDHLARVLPPVVVETRNYPVYDYDHGSYPVRDCEGPPPVRRYYAEAQPNPVYPHGRDFRYERYGHRGYPAPHGHGHEGPRFWGRR